MAPKDEKPDKPERFSVSRRDFLKSAGVTGIAAGVAGGVAELDAQTGAGARVIGPGDVPVQLMVNGKRLHLTISVGIVSSTAIGGDAVGTNLKEHADEALYTAKRAGRDRVSVWDESLPLTLTPIHMMVVPAKSRL